MSIRDINKQYTIQDGTTGVIKYNVENNLFTDYGEQEFKISVGDFLLLQNVKAVLLNEHDCIIKFGYKNQAY